MDTKITLLGLIVVVAAIGVTTSIMSSGTSAYAQTSTVSPPDRCESQNQPSPQSACSYAPGSNANAASGPGAPSASQLTLASEDRAFCGGTISCTGPGNTASPTTFAPGQNLNRP